MSQIEQHALGYTSMTSLGLSCAGYNFDDQARVARLVVVRTDNDYGRRPLHEMRWSFVTHLHTTGMFIVVFLFVTTLHISSLQHKSRSTNGLRTYLYNRWSIVVMAFMLVTTIYIRECWMWDYFHAVMAWEKQYLQWWFQWKLLKCVTVGGAVQKKNVPFC